MDFLLCNCYTATNTYEGNNLLIIFCISYNLKKGFPNELQNTMLIKTKSQNVNGYNLGKW